MPAPCEPQGSPREGAPIQLVSSPESSLWDLRLRLRRLFDQADKNPQDADHIIMKHTGLDKSALLAGGHDITKAQLAATQLAAIEADTAARLSGRPLQYILGEWEFYSLPFYVGEGVLVPRPETELLVDFALNFLQNQAENSPPPVVYDLCSGSGCIAVAVGKNCPAARVFALELSDEAFGYLCKNIELNGTKNVTPVKADVLAGRALLDIPAPDLILSNPPYIPAGDMDTLMDEVTHEPDMALIGGADGLDFYRALTKLWLPLLREKPQGGRLAAFEAGLGQHEAVSALISQAGFTAGFIRDLSGIERVITAKQEG